MKGQDGVAITEKQGIMDAFAEFYEALYATRRIDEVIKPDMTSRECVPVQPITADEVRACLSKMAKCKAGDEQGIVVEMLQKGGDHLMQVLVELFNDILDPASMPPEQWRMAKLIVLFKKGDAASNSTNIIQGVHQNYL